MLFDQPRNGHFGGTGTTIARAVKRGIIFWTGVAKTHEPHLMRVKGLVPDGVTAVRLSKTAVAPTGSSFGGARAVLSARGVASLARPEET
jgi:hypothetical protein